MDYVFLSLDAQEFLKSGIDTRTLRYSCLLETFEEERRRDDFNFVVVDFCFHGAGKV